MKQSIFIAAFLLLASPSLAFASFDTSLRYGSHGDKVTELQEFLTEQGVYTGPITGNFYALTLAGVKAFQGAHSITPTSGFFGPITRGIADTILSSELTQSDEEASTTPVFIQPKRTHMTDETTSTPTGSNVQAPSTQAGTAAPSAPASQARIEIVSTDPSKQLDATFKVAPDGVNTWDEATDTMQFASVGAIVYDANGDNTRSEVVTVDGKTLNGTGNQLGNTGLFYYPLRFLFKAAGGHTITFTSADGVSASVTLTAE